MTCQKYLSKILRFSLFLIIVLQFSSCSTKQFKIEFVVEKNNKLQIIERGALINGIREGYWITFSQENHTIEIEAYYVHGVLNGPLKLYSRSGYLMSEGPVINNSSNGIWSYYFSNGTLSARGLLENDERAGLWEEYVEDGRLDKKILYKDGKDSILIDNKLSIPVPPPVNN
jgi:antitoxin component YwqK of YwqJK toxin-antitoxin module